MNYSDYLAIYRSKLGTVDDCLDAIDDGDILCPAGNLCEPVQILSNIQKISSRIENIEILRAKGIPYPVYGMPELRGKIDVVSHFFEPGVREGFKNGLVTYYPCHLHDYLPVRYAHRKANVFLATCTPMDENGNLMVSGEMLFETEAVAAADKILLEVNPALPRIKGSITIPIEKVTRLTEVSTPLFIVPRSTPSEVDKAVGGYASELIKDGDCIQIGIGGMPDTIAVNLRNRHDLGLHTEMFSSYVGDLIEMGVINGSKKNYDTGLHIGSFVLGDEKLFKVLESNPNVRICPASYTNDPFNIARIDNMVSVNSAMEVDLTGQICSESIGPSQFSGEGGAFEFAYGVSQSKGGRGIITIPSTAKGGTVSRIKATLTPGAAVTITRSIADNVVTEFGVARLSGRSVRERVNNLIAVAHPDFRAELRAEARKLGYL